MNYLAQLCHKFKSMLFKLPSVQKLWQKRTASDLNDTLYPIYFIIMGLIFGGVLMLSAINDFLFLVFWFAVFYIDISISLIFALVSVIDLY